jgi:hypothetical protein
MMSTLTILAIDLFDFLHVWQNIQRAITLLYDIRLRKYIYFKNQCDEPIIMELVSFDSEKFHF